MIWTVITLCLLAAVTAAFVWVLAEAAATSRHKRQLEILAAANRAAALATLSARAENEAQREHEKLQWEHDAQ